MKEEKFNWQRLLIAIGIVVLTALVVGGLTWYVMDSQNKKEKAEYGKQIQALDKLTKEAKTTSSTATTPKPEDETANWKTYTNATYGFSIKYPESHTYKTDNNSNPFALGILDKKYLNLQTEVPIIFVTIWTKNDNQTLSDWIKKTRGETYIDNSLGDCQLSGQNAKCYLEGGFGGNHTVYSIERGNNIYSVSYLKEIDYGVNSETLINTFRVN